MKRIAVIARGLTKGGVTRFILSILDQYEMENSSEYKIIIFHDDTFLEYDHYENLEKVYLPGKNHRIGKFIWDYFKLPFLLYKYKLDAIIYPKNIILITHFFLKAKKYNVIHDLGYFEKSFAIYKFLDRVYMKLCMKLSCLMATKVFAVFQATKDKIIQFFHIDPDKIIVTQEGIEPHFTKITDAKRVQEVIEKYNIKLPFLFYCGSISPRKNLLRIMQAFSNLKEKIPHNLYLTGKYEWHSHEIFQIIKENNLENRVIRLGFVEEEDLPVLYSLADAFLYLSLYEGFGLPILEAQACECPLLVSNTTSCPEVAGADAYLIDPYSVEDIKDGISHLLQDEDMRIKTVQAGKENIKRFSWGKTAHIILKNL